MSAAVLLALFGVLLAAAVAAVALIEHLAARSRSRHRDELALHRHQLRITLRRNERLLERVETMAARVEAAGETDAEPADGEGCGCGRCARLAIAVELREHTAPWMVPIVVGDRVPRQVGFCLRWGSC